MTYLHRGIIKMIITKPVYIKLINNEYACRFKNDINLKKTFIICNINNCFKIVMKLDIAFIIFSKKNVIQFDEQKNDKDLLLGNFIKRK